MNKNVTTQAELLANAQEILENEGLESLSIRRLAKESHVSVGTIYNYFPNKSALFLELIKNFWQKVFKQSKYEQKSDESFALYIHHVYTDLAFGFKGFTSDYLKEMAYLNADEKQKGREMEELFWKQMKQMFLNVLESDENVNETTWTATFTKAVFVNFVFESIMSMLRSQKESCEALIEVINRIIY